MNPAGFVLVQLQTLESALARETAVSLLAVELTSYHVSNVLFTFPGSLGKGSV